MYKKINAVLAFIVMLVLLSAAVLWGAYKGWSSERSQVESSMNTLYDMLGARREIGNNILTVAKRHLSGEDALIRSLREDIKALEKNDSFEVLAQSNERFERDAKALLSHLSTQLSLQADERDSMYAMQMLPQALQESARLTEQAEYNRHAAAFNESMKSRFSGRLAGILGIHKAQQFIVQEDTP